MLGGEHVFDVFALGSLQVLQVNFYRVEVGNHLVLLVLLGLAAGVERVAPLEKGADVIHVVVEEVDHDCIFILQFEVKLKFILFA